MSDRYYIFDNQKDSGQEWTPSDIGERYEQLQAENKRLKQERDYLFKEQVDLICGELSSAGEEKVSKELEEELKALGASTEETICPRCKSDGTGATHCTHRTKGHPNYYKGERRKANDE